MFSPSWILSSYTHVSFSELFSRGGNYFERLLYNVQSDMLKFN